MMNPTSHYPDRSETALDIAKRRYAAGELTREAFDKMKADLTASAGGRASIGPFPKSNANWLFPAALLFLCLLVITAFAALYGWGPMNDDFITRHMGPGMMGTGIITTDTTPTIGSATQAVEIRDFAYRPSNLQVPIGATVTWTNDDEAPHTATATDKSWDTGIVNKGDKKTLTFNKAGANTYYCTVHPNMQAVLTVR